MLRIAVDACSATHAKALRASGAGAALNGLGLLDLVLQEGARFLTTKAVYGELVTMTLQATLAQWEAVGGLTVEKVSLNAVRTFQNRVPKRTPRPGRNDIALVCATHQSGAVLLTHDNGAATYANAAKLTTIDLLDIGVLLAERGACELDDLEAVFAAFNEPGAFRPADWRGSVRSTVLVRDHLDALVRELTQSIDYEG